MKVIPCGDRILIKKNEEEVSRSSSGIFIPEEVKSSTSIILGRIEEIGEGDKAKKFQKGQLVMVNKYSGSEFSSLLEDEEKYLIVSADDILAKVN